MVEELENRGTGKAVSHFQASLLNERMNGGSKLNLNLLYKRIPPHERAYLFERCESHKQSLEKTLLMESNWHGKSEKAAIWRTAT